MTHHNKKKTKKKDNKYYSVPLILIPLFVIVVLFLASCVSPTGDNTMAKYSYIGVNKVCSEPTNGVVHYNPILGYFETLALDDTAFPVPYVMFQQHKQDGTLGKINTEGFC
jgi:hypothetical protein